MIIHRISPMQGITVTTTHSKTPNINGQIGCMAACGATRFRIRSPSMCDTISLAPYTMTKIGSEKVNASAAPPVSRVGPRSLPRVAVINKAHAMMIRITSAMAPTRMASVVGIPHRVATNGLDRAWSDRWLKRPGALQASSTPSTINVRNVCNCPRRRCLILAVKVSGSCWSCA